MSKFDDKVELYKAAAKKSNLSIPEDLLIKVTKGLGPSIYKKDAEIVSCSQKDEKERVVENFLKKKLNLTHSDEELMKAVDEVCEEIGKSNPAKYRPIFYALLTMKYKKEDVYA